MMIWVLTSCSSNSFYSKIKANPKVYHHFLSFKGIRKNLNHLDQNFVNTEKLIYIATSQYPNSYSIYYDQTNKNSYYVSKFVFDKNSKYYSDPLSEIDNQKFSTLKYALNSVLNDELEKLESISKEAYHFTTDTEFIAIILIDVSTKMYKKYQFGSFEVYNGKPIMTEDEYWSIDWSKFQD